MSERVSVTGALRSDQTRFAVLNRRVRVPAIVVAPTRTLAAISPMVDVNWRLGLLSSAYASVSTSFETPTTTELANQPDGSGGLNRELKPQRGTSYEVGFKGARANGLRYDLALFLIDTRDELIPFEIPGGAGRRFFRNAGRTSRAGAEVGLSGSAGPVSLGGAATWLRYAYEDFVVGGTSFNDHRVPGVAPLTVNAYAGLRPSWGAVTLEAQRTGRLPTDDANTTYADAYTLLNVRVALRVPTRLAVEPAFGIDNLFDATYASNVVVNAARGRFFEPGPGRTVYFLVRMGTRR